jgi:N-acetylglucosaminyl-diphospho-decaprenol L-rhamnosyltransferase
VPCMRESAEPLQSAGISAVVVTYNSGRHLRPLGRALSTGTLRPATMIAVDNASLDDSVAQARQAGFEVHRLDSNKGFGAACNIGLQLARTDLVLFCNPDVRPGPAALADLVAALGSREDTAIAGVEGRPFSTLGRYVAGFLPTLNTRSRPVLFGYRPQADDTAQTGTVADYAVGAFFLCRREAVLAVGGFDETFFLYSEEEDLARRLAGCGWLTVVAPSASIDHRSSTSSAGDDQGTLAAFLFHSLYWYFRKHRSRRYAEVARLAIAGCLLMDRALRALAGKPQFYDRTAITAAFRSIQALRSAHDCRATSAGK